MTAIILRAPLADRDSVHQRQAEVINDHSAPKAVCTQNAYEVILWDGEPSEDEIARAAVAE